MIDLAKIKGVIFDYGGTIDSNGKHWAEVLWEAYVDQKVPLNKNQFREAYVYAERYLALHPVILADDNFLDLLKKKTEIQFKYIVEKGFLPNNDKSYRYSIDISNQCYNFVRSILKKAKPVIDALSQCYPLVLVSNFYGNIQEILCDFDLAVYFDDVIESAVVGVRKPDPAIFSMGVDSLGFRPEEVVVIGDAYTKDIVPANTIGCQTIWLKGIGWDSTEEQIVPVANEVIGNFTDLKNIFGLRI